MPGARAAQDDDCRNSVRCLSLALLVIAASLLNACGSSGESATGGSGGGSTGGGGADTTPPSRPSNFAATAAGSTAANLSWNASTDNVGVTGYIVRRNNVQVATPVATSYFDSGLSAATTYNYTVAARDAAGNTSTRANASVTTAGGGGGGDTTPPSQPGNFTAAAAGSTGANLSWTASTDNVAVTGYVVSRDGTQIGAPSTTSFVDSGLSASTAYTYTVAARDAAGNLSTPASASVTTAAPDTIPPSQPGNFTATAAGSTGANLSWNASTDNIGVAGYIVSRDGAPIATLTTTNFLDSTLSPTTSYSYTVVARDAAGNTSTPAGASVTTASAPPPYYVADATGNDSNTCTAAQNPATPKKTIQAGLGCLALTPGATLIIRDGTYSGNANALANLPSGSAGNYKTIKAENEGNVIITAGLNMSNDAYLIIQGLRFQDELEHRVSGNHLKLFRNEFKGGCRPSGNCTNTVVGGTDILFEDNWWHGLGGRYNVLVYNSDRVVVRRGVIRHDGGWTDTNDPEDPEAGLNFYNSSNCSAQNTIILDSNLVYKTWQSAFYSVSNSSSSPHPNSDNSWLGIIALNNFSGAGGAGLRYDGIASQSGHVVEDAVLWDASWGMNVAFSRPSASVDVAASRLTIGRTSGSGTGIGGDSAGAKSFTDVRLFNVSIEDVTVTNTATGAPTFLPQQLAGVGANVVNRIGTAGTLQGETGWNTDTGVGLWPFPNEARIMKEMCTDADASLRRGFCLDTSLTNYIMNYLGNGNPY